MKKLNLKKYFFSYLYIFFGLVTFFSYVLSKIFLEKNPLINTHEPMAETVVNPEFSVLFILSGIVYIYCNGLLLLEIILRFLIEKFFPNCNFSFKFNLSNTQKQILTIIFYVLFLFATFPHIIFIKNQLK